MLLKRILGARSHRPLRDQFRYWIALLIIASMALGILAALWDRLGTQQ